MAATKLNSNAIKAGILLLLNCLLWFVQTCVDYLIADAGFWGVGGLIQNLITVELAKPMSVFFLATIFIAAITLLTRNRMAAVIGLLILASYYGFAAFSQGFTSSIDVTVLTCAVIFTAAAVGVSDGDARVICGIACVLIVLFVLLHVGFRIANGGYGSMFAGVPVIIIYELRYLMLVAGLFFAATVESGK